MASVAQQVIEVDVAPVGQRGEVRRARRVVAERTDLAQAVRTTTHPQHRRCT
ncbi:MAG TPA: hypothetical protein VIZ17_12185 [Acetobacteraceae bacterium]